MTDLSAPYNFVPLNGKVFRPGWAKHLSMDIPQPGAICGSFDITVTTVTPLMLGGQQTKSDGRESNAKSAFLLEGRPAIPGSSLKGMLRSLLEIAAFGKIGPHMDDRRYGLRDLYNHRDYLSRMTDMFRPLSRAGWLSLDAGGGWRLTPCAYSFVRQVELEALRGGRVNLGLRQLAGVKYKAWGRDLSVRFDPGPVTAEGDWAGGRMISRAASLGRGRTEGVIVFTGQPQERQRANSKQTEFIFHSPAADALPVSAEVREAFEFVHRDPNTRAPNDEWAFWRDDLNKGIRPMPVFWLDDGKGGVAALGLAMMFRLAYDRSTRDLAKRAHADHVSATPDLAETLFGFVAEGKSDDTQALKGRIRVTPARIEREGPKMAEVSAVLLAPKPNFYPAYVGQRHLDHGEPPRVKETSYRGDDGKSRPTKAYTTYQQEYATLRGWKRYPVSRSRWKTALTAPAAGLGRQGRADPDNTKVRTRFTPWGPGSTFRATVHVHNLRPEELGALVWSLTFGGRDQLCHSLGMGKPLGLGVVSLRIDPASIDLDDVDGRAWQKDAAILTRSMQDFVKLMEDQIPGWGKSPQIQHLLAMADPDLGDRQAALLTPMDSPKAFIAAKKEGLVLPPYSPVDPWPVPIAIAMAPPPNRQAPRGRAAPPPRGTVDGEAVEVISRDGDKLVVRFLDSNDTEIVAEDDFQPA